MNLLAIKDVPIGFFAMTMALCGLSLGWRLSGLSSIFSAALSYFSMGIFVIVFSLYGIKFIKHRSSVMAEFTHPISMSFFGTISVSIMFVGSLLVPTFHHFALFLWILGTVLHSLLVLHTLGQWLFFQKISIEDFNPACFIPIVGAAAVPIFGANHGFMEISWIFFGISSILWIILLAFIMYRLMFVRPLPAPMMPTMFILLAPPSILCSDSLLLAGAEMLELSMVLYSVALVFALLLLSHIKLFRVPFSMSYWAFTFPVVAFSMANLLMGKNMNSQLLLSAGHVLLCVATLIIGSIFVATVQKVVLQK